ncbi:MULTISPECIES: hypothetical protein [unclassified Coleofasciculus]|uniref:hypothetical protein n=1 Tax=unclassified Coleofasciculus TaxID=2692782 RepID=UPI00187F1F74|nr:MULTISPECIES: hypothetical protein [unclassified Coleofasciculus]MBE9129664.1 hypothetical protein [Coleofasciculus sp. LEGE 07081]MBE9152172.1 hypothetical protein [Coleofasciculus sp. LEGE 07092]
MSPTQPLGLNNSLVPSQSLLQTLGQPQLLNPLGATPLGSSTLSHVQQGGESLLSPYGKSSFAAMSQYAESAVSLDDKNRVREHINAPQQEIRFQKQDVPHTEVNQQIAAAQEVLSLPRVLDNLTQISPLGCSKSLGQDSVKILQVFPPVAEPSLSNKPNPVFPPIQRKSAPLVDNFVGTNRSILNATKTDSSRQFTNSNLPASWSSLAELMSEIAPLDSQPAMLQTDADNESETLFFTPEGFRKIPSPPVKFPNQVADAATQLPIGTIQPSSTTQDSREDSTVSESDLDSLAREVFRLVRQRLQIERERYRRY